MVGQTLILRRSYWKKELKSGPKYMLRMNNRSRFSWGSLSPSHGMGRVGRGLGLRMLLVAAMALLVTPSLGQEVPGFGTSSQELVGEGWQGFLDFWFLGRALLSLLLATFLAALIAYHPRSHRRVDSLDEVEVPKILIMYAVVGAVIGIMVLKYGLVVGFVVFGIGGLIRFRTDLGSATKTGRVIFVTVMGLCAGLDLPHVAVVATGFGFILIYVLDARPAYRIIVKGLVAEHVPEAAEFYRSVLEQQGCRILGEKKDFNKGQVSLVFRSSPQVDREDLTHLFEVDVPEEVKGLVDWQTG